MKLVTLPLLPLHNVDTDVTVLWADSSAGDLYQTVVRTKIDLFRTYCGRKPAEDEGNKIQLARWLLRAAIFEEARADLDFKAADYFTDKGEPEEVELISATVVHGGQITPVCHNVFFAA